MKSFSSFALLAIAATAVNAYTDAQTSCATNATSTYCSGVSSFTDSTCACSDEFQQAVKVCLYQGGDSADVSTWFTEIAEDCSNANSTSATSSAAASTATAATSTSLTDAQTTCANNATSTSCSGSSSFTDSTCACSDDFQQAVKVCLYQGENSADVSTWFSAIADICSAAGGGSSATASSTAATGASSSVAETVASAVAAASSSASATSAGLASFGLGDGHLVGLALAGAVFGGAVLF